MGVLVTMVLTCNEKGYGSIDYAKLGANITEMRNNLGITQDRLSDLLKVSRKTVSNWETGDKRPSLDNLSALCDVFHCDIEYLLGKRDFPTKEIEVVCTYTGMSQKTIKKIHHAALQDEKENYIDTFKLNSFLSDLLDNYPDFENLLTQLELHMMNGAMSFYAKKNPKALGASLHEKYNGREADLALMRLMHFAESLKEKCVRDNYIFKRLYTNGMYRQLLNESLENPKAKQ